MAICPNCGKRITFLKNYVHGCTVEYIFDGESYEFVDCVGGSLEEFAVLNVVIRLLRMSNRQRSS